MMDDRLARLRESKAAYDAEKRAEAEAVNAAAEKARADGFEDGTAWALSLSEAEAGYEQLLRYCGNDPLTKETSQPGMIARGLAREVGHGIVVTDNQRVAEAYDRGFREGAQSVRDQVESGDEQA